MKMARIGHSQGMRPAGRSYGRAPHERGIALVVALVFLLMLTILGVTVMNTASLEGRMAGNTQETNRAFHAAESAIERVYTDGTIFLTLLTTGASSSTPVKYPDATNPTVTVTVTSTNIGPRNKLPRASGQDINSNPNYTAGSFDIGSDASTTSTGANSKLQRGAWQLQHK